MTRRDTPIGMKPVPGGLRKEFAVYILASRPRGVLYVGVTSALADRVWEHREGVVPGFTSRYGVTHLVYFEFMNSADEAIAREKQLKRWRRAWKVALIEGVNPTGRDLWRDIAIT